MNYQTAAIVGGVAFLLSAVAGLVRGVGLIDLLFRAFVWALVGFGGSLGVEAVLRNLLPDLFTPVESVDDGPESDRRVDIVLDDDRPASVFEEVDDSGAETPAPGTPRTEAPRAGGSHPFAER